LLCPSATLKAVTDSQHILDKAILAIQYGDRSSGARLLAQVLRADPQNVRAWLWMSEIADTETQRRECLQRAIALDPENRTARARLSQLDARASVRAAPHQKGTRRKIILAGALTLSLVVGLALLLYVLTAVVPRVRARAERLYRSYPQTATLWCPSCARTGKPVLLQASLGAGLFGRPIGDLAHGTTVTVLEYQWSPLEQTYYVEVVAGGQQGWIPESMLKQAPP
jgi:Tfp pilus assembly protein PilF